ncbi:MAG TPA: C45 family peptidase [Kofleriaceae bacterium]|nr:C45 family peptidase [Kofleriaceae bacterium]
MPDLVIGSRRTGVPRPWRAGVIAVGLLGVVVVVAWFIYRRSVAYDMPGGEIQGEIAEVEPAAGTLPVLVYGSSSLTWVGGIPLLRMTGDAHAIGAAHGRLLAPLLPATVRAIAPSIENTVSYDGLLGGTTHGIRLAWRWRFVDDGMIEADRRMVAGLARGAAASGVDVAFDDLLRDQAMLDVGAPSPRSPEADQHSIARSLTIVATQATPGRVWIGRSFSLPGLDDGGDAETPVVEIAHPEGRLAWAAVGWAGQLGVVTGINAAGIAVMVDPTRTGDVRITRTARPISLLARSVLEQAKTLDEAVKMIESSQTLGAAVVVVVDGATGRWLVVERTPSKAIVEKTPRLPVVGDVLTTNALASDPENDRARRSLPTIGRVERAAKLVRAPLADISQMAAVLRDQRNIDDTMRPAGHRGVIDDGRAVQSVILDPMTLELWVADPRSNGRFRGFDLRHELRGDGDRAIPPSDIMPDPASDPDRLASLAAARADLRDARDALAKNDRARAVEACARARARAPSLPEAVELDAIVSQLRGDDAHARASFQRWLDGGPDDPAGEERARAAITP